MDVLSHLQRQLTDYTASLYHEGIVDDQFMQLQKLQDKNNPNFVFEVVTLFFEDAEKHINSITRTLEQPQHGMDFFTQVDASSHQLRGSSSSVGASRIRDLCIAFRTYCEARNHDGCLRCVQQLTHEYSLFKNKLQTFFTLQQQIVAAGGSTQ